MLRSLILQERQVVSRNGRWYAVRIMPYRTQANRIDGVVITFIDISKAKILENALRQLLTALQDESPKTDLNAADKRQ